MWSAATCRRFSAGTTCRPSSTAFSGAFAIPCQSCFTLLAGISATQMEIKFQCPKCQRPIVSRRNSICQYCGVALPEHLLWTKAEIEMQDRRLVEKERIRRISAEDDKEEDRRKSPTNGWNVSDNFEF